MEQPAGRFCPLFLYFFMFPTSIPMSVPMPMPTPIPVFFSLFISTIYFYFRFYFHFRFCFCFLFFFASSVLSSLDTEGGRRRGWGGENVLASIIITTPLLHVITNQLIFFLLARWVCVIVGCVGFCVGLLGVCVWLTACLGVCGVCGGVWVCWTPWRRRYWTRLDSTRKCF